MSRNQTSGGNASLLFRVLFTLLCISFTMGASASKMPRKIVLIAGPITGHDKHTHEYEKSVTLLKQLLDTSPSLKGVRTEAYYRGWVPDEKTLEDADTIVYVTDGGDHREADHPLYVGNRFSTIEKQMKRGCGLVLFHWSTFHPTRVHDQITDWVGGYFDYETGNTPNKWYSAIQTWTATTTLPHPEHPISRGVAPYTAPEEFYYNIRFRENDSRVTPILSTQPPNTNREYPVGWAVQRTNGGRGFGFTGGHFYKNWWNPNFRKLILNAIVWTAHTEIPENGVESRLDPPKKVLVLTGHHHPGHDWRNLTSALLLALEQDPRLLVDVTESIEDLATSKIEGYDLLVMNYNNWEKPGLSDAAKEGFLRAIKQGKGLALVHFANGAFNYTLPNKESEWAEYRTKIVARAWMHDSNSSHDAFNKFQVSPTSTRHVITKDLAPFETEDELYFNQKGELKVTPLAVAHSKVTKNLEPMAWAYNYDKGRIFQTVLGHAESSVRHAAALIRRGSVWAMRLSPLTFDPPTELTENALFRNGSGWTVERSLNSARLASLNPTPQPNPQASNTPLPKIDPKTTVDWAVVGNDSGGMRYSKLKQINRQNVKDLKVAWTLDLNEATPGSTIECVPVVIEGVMYLTTTRLKILALDATTGREIWRFDPKSGGVNRGIGYWSDGKPNGERRVVFGTPDGRLLSLHARTGVLDTKFGKNGVLDLRAGIERDLSHMNYGTTSAPAIFEDTIYIGIINTEDQPGAPGDIRAFNVRTGREVWRFHTVPHPYEFGNDTWEGDSWKNRSGVNPWSGFTIDTKRGILFCGTGSAASDFYGADRNGANLFANSTLALDARTGKYLWHFQAVHHDIWDHDNPCPPVLVTMNRDGKRVDAVAQPTKTGFVYLFDRVTGKPLFEVKEVPTTPSDIPGEQAYPTQPEPVAPPPLTPRLFTSNDVTNISPESTASVREMLKSLRYGLPYQPPSVEGTVIAPGFHGGATWSGASFDPTTGLLYVNTNNVLYINKLNPDGKGNYNFDGYTYFYDKFGYPANKPPWGHLTAVDLNTGTFTWRISIGAYPELLAKGIPPTGTENFGGTITTEGGLVFIGATKDEKFHAFDKTTGKLLWEYQLPFGGYTTPCTYMVNGRQYVTIAAGGGGKLRTKSGDRFITFALPTH